MTQKQALKSLKDYCKVNNIHLTSSSFTRNDYAIAVHGITKPGAEYLKMKNHATV